MDVGEGLGVDVSGRAHEREHGTRYAYAQKRDRKTAYKCKPHGSMHGGEDLLVIVCAEVLAYDDRAASADADRKADGEVGERGCGLDGG